MRGIIATACTVQRDRTAAAGNQQRNQSQQENTESRTEAKRGSVQGWSVEGVEACRRERGLTREPKCAWR